jgi:hypothetical protein
MISSEGGKPPFRYLPPGFARAKPALEIEKRTYANHLLAAVGMLGHQESAVSFYPLLR